jgi:hypothetical protein
VGAAVAISFAKRQKKGNGFRRKIPRVRWLSACKREVRTQSSTGPEIEDVKEIAVKPETCSALVLTATTTQTGNYSAEEYRVNVSIPFPFVVGSQMLPSGAYLISARRTSPDSLSLLNLDEDAQVQVKGWPLKWYPERDDAIVFHKFRTMYRLTDIHFAHSSINIHFPTIAAETWDLPRRARPDGLCTPVERYD